MQKLITAKWANEIRAEHQQMVESGEEFGPRHPMMEHLLARWENGSQRLWLNLKRMNLVQPLAQVLLHRMYQRMTELERSGMPPTDAREQAEREILMLEPEQEQEAENGLAELDRLLQESRQMVAEFRASKE